MRVCNWCQREYPKRPKLSYRQYELSRYCSKMCANRGLSEATTTDPIERFWSKVDKTGDCWLWTGGVTDCGYGQFAPTHTTWALAHRFSFELLTGPIPVGMQLDHRHTCPKSCVNPSHLHPVTNKQNAENRAGAQRNNKSSGIRNVYRHEDGVRWLVHTRHHGRSYYGGVFSDLATAEAAAIALRNRLFTHNDADRVGA
jgi:hypothetical protein